MGRGLIGYGPPRRYSQSTSTKYTRQLGAYEEIDPITFTAVSSSSSNFGQGMSGLYTQRSTCLLYTLKLI